MLNYEHIPFVATSVFVLIMSALIIYLIRIALKDKRDEETFDKQLEFTLNPSGVNDEKKEGFFTAKLKVLPEKLIKSGMIEDMEEEEIQKKLFLIEALVFTMAAFFGRHIVAGIIPAIALYGGLHLTASIKIGKIKTLMEEQIPAFISTFKANIQANQHSQIAMVRAIDSTATPLFDELKRSKSIMEAGDFRAGIVTLRQNTENETLRQMASCIELASTSGSNIEEQVEIIEKIIIDNQDIARKKKLGVNENKPLFLVAALFVPLSFIGSYFLSEMHRDFWFQSTLSWIVIIAVIIIMIIASFFTWKTIQKIDI